MPYGTPNPHSDKHLVGIKQKNGTVQFRWVSSGYTPPKTIRRSETKWASCEINNKTEPAPPQFGIVGMTQSGQPIYDVVKTQMMSFSSPCPIGTPKKPHKAKKAKAVKLGANTGSMNTRR